MARARRRQIKLDGSGWVMAQHVGVKIVDELKFANITFRYVVTYRQDGPSEEFIEVDDAVAKAVKLYMDNGGFAGMPLVQFLKKIGVI